MGNSCNRALLSQQVLDRKGGQRKRQREKFTGNRDKVSSSLHWWGGYYKGPECFPVDLSASFASITNKVSEHQPPSWACPCLSLTLAPGAVLVNAATVTTLNLQQPSPFLSLSPAPSILKAHGRVRLIALNLTLKLKKMITWLFFSCLPQKAAAPRQRWFPWQVEDWRRNGSWSRNSEEVFPGKLEVMIWPLTYSCSTQASRGFLKTPGQISRMKQKKTKLSVLCCFQKVTALQQWLKWHAPSWTNQHHPRAFGFQTAKIMVYLEMRIISIYLRGVFILNIPPLFLGQKTALVPLHRAKTGVSVYNHICMCTYTNKIASEFRL